MARPITVVPIHHHLAVHEIATDPEPQRQFTLLELVEAVGECADTEHEVIATVSYMLRSGRIALTGNFRDTPIEKLCG